MLGVQNPVLVTSLGVSATIKDREEMHSADGI